MSLRHALVFTAKAAVVGLAAAFIVMVVKPSLIGKHSNPVEIREVAATTTAPKAAPASYAPAVQRAAPAVVNINTAKVVTVQPNPLYNDPFFRRFFGDLIQGQNIPRKQVENSLGSGVIISPQGYILTNNHVIQGADEIHVHLHDGRSAQAKVIGADPDTDVAVLKIALDNLPVITLGDSNALRVGDVVLAIGNPYGVGQTVTMGIVSATGRNHLGINTFENFIQTDAAINPGNSGGALVDTNGNLIGINSAIYSRTGGYQGIGFAIPTSMAKKVMEQIIQYGHPIRGWLGFEGQEITPKLAAALHLSRSSGVIVTAVVRNGPAHRAGLVPGDILVAVDGHTLSSAHQALTLISNHRPGDSVHLTVVRNGQQKELKATAIERPQTKWQGS